MPGWFEKTPREGAFVGASRRSLARTERSEPATDGLAEAKAPGAFVGGVRGSGQAAAASS